MDGGRVLVAGASGVVGLAAAKRFAREPGWQVVGLSRRRPLLYPDAAEWVGVDLADADATRRAVEELGDVTHVVYAALYEKPGLFQGWYERDQMERNRLMLQNLLDPLLERAGGLQHLSLLQGTKAYGAHVGGMRMPGREREPRHQHENFYWLQEDLVRERQAGQAWSFSIIRPQIIFGEALGSNMNAIPAIGVYAALLRSDGEPLHYPGGASMLSEAVDADLVAEMLHWVATTPTCAGETYNVTNGDVFSMRASWPAIADALGMELGEDRPMSLAQEVPRREGDWAGLVERFRLTAPPSLDAVVGQSFLYADMLLGHGMPEAPHGAFVSTIKARKAGFAACEDTDDMFQRIIGSLQDQRVLPPRSW